MRRNRRHLQAVPNAVTADILEDDILEDDILEDDILEDDILEDDILQDDILQDDILQDDILQAIPENVPEINPETSELSRRVADRGNPERTLQNTPSHTSSGRVVRKPKRYIEEY